MARILTKGRSGVVPPRPRSSFERDHQLADQVAFPGDMQLSGTYAAVGRPAGVGDAPVALGPHVPDLDLVVGRARLVRCADLAAAVKGTDRNALEANLGVIREPAAEGVPVAAPHRGVVGCDVLVEEAHGSRSSRTRP